MTTHVAAKILSVMAAAALAGMVGFAAVAQEKPATKTEKKVKAPSPCKDLDETSCKAKAECGWTKAAKNAEGKETRKAYCHLKRKAAKKSEKTEK